MSMLDSKAALRHQHDEFEPTTELVSEDDCDTLLLYLPGFKKHELRVQVSTNRKLRISGQRRQSSEEEAGEKGTSSSRFHKEFLISENCDTNGITAKFEGDILYITQPKIITSQTINDNTRHEKDNHELPNANPNPNPNINLSPNPNNAKKKQQDNTNDEDVAHKKKQKQQSVNDNIIKNGKLTNGAMEKLRKKNRGKMIMTVLSFFVLLLLGIYATTWNIPSDI